jgi:hypothetical protein
LSVYLKPDSLSAKDQGVVSIPVYASSSSSVSGIGTLSFRLDMRTDLLTPETVSSPIPGAGTAPLQVDASGTSITITLPPNYSISSEILIATINCMAYVTDTANGKINLSSASSSGAANCLSVSGAGTETFTLTPECGSMELTQFLSTGQPFTIIGIVPNPAQSAIRVSLSKADISPVLAELYDILGSQILSQDESGTDFTLDLGAVAEGSYYLRLSGQSETLTRKIEVMK